MKKPRHDFMTYFIRWPKVGYIVTLMILLIGIASAFLIPKENFPNISFGQVVISTVYPGASAVDIDQLITKKIESKIKSVDGIDAINSSSRNGVSSVVVQFEPDADTEKAINEIRSEIDEVKPELPSEVDNGPTIMEIDTSLTPIMAVVLSGEYSQLELSEFAEELQDHLEDVPNVAQVTTSTDVSREIIVELDRNKMEQYGLSAQEVTSQISAANRDVPLGNLDIGDLTYTMRFAGKFVDESDVANVRLRSINGDDGSAVLYVRDVANVEERGKDSDKIERVFVPDQQYVGDAVMVTVSKDDGTNIFNVADTVREDAKAFAEENFPEDLEVTFSQEADVEVARSYDLLLQSMISAILVVMGLIFVLVGFKEGMIAGMVIPLSFISTITVLNLIGSSLNFMTNFSMILALGILVDTAIVVVEGAHDFIKKGYSPTDAAVLSLKEFRQPLVSGTLTTLAVFVPLFTLPGVLGKFLTFIPVTVFIVLTASLFISLFLITLYSSRFLKPDNPNKKRNIVGKFFYGLRKGFNKIQNGIIRGYGAIVAVILKTRIVRLGALIIVTGVFFVSWLIPVQFVLFPDGDANFFQITVTRPIGTVTESVAEYVAPIEKEVIDQPEVKLLTSAINGNSASMTVELIASEDRKLAGLRESQDVVSFLTDSFEKYEDAEIRVRNAESGPPSEAPVVIRIIADNSEVLGEAEAVAEDFKKILEEIPGTAGISDDIDKIPGEINYKVNREKALAYGINPDVVFLQLRSVLQGSKATVINRGTKDIDVTVQYAEADVDTLDEIRALPLLSNTGSYVSLGEITDFEISPALNVVKRVDRNIAFTVSSLLTPEGNAQVVTDEFLKKIENYEMPKGVSYETAGENEENADLLVAMGIAFVVAMFLMFLILVIQFNSYAQPFIILSTIIFANIGVNVGLWLTGTERGLPVILGFIALAGVVVNDAIILIDQINRKKRAKLVSVESVKMMTDDDEVDEAKVVDGYLKKDELIDVIADSGRTRFNPILLTTLTTVAGIFPLVKVDTFWAGLSYTVIFGLMAASFLTLFITPIVYYQFEREKLVTFMPVITLVLAGVAAGLLTGAIPGGSVVAGVVVGALAVIAFVIMVRAFVKARKMDREDLRTSM